MQALFYEFLHFFKNSCLWRVPRVREDKDISEKKGINNFWLF